MPVTIRTMSNNEFDQFFQWSAKNHAAELMNELRITKEHARSEAWKELNEMLPQGLDTTGNYFMTILEAETEEHVGFIWTLHEEFQGRRQSFLCDFVIWEPKRRKGYATAALLLAEKKAAEAGCQESVLFVSNDNDAAKALYLKCGYRLLRHADHGSYMMKPL